MPGSWIQEKRPVLIYIIRIPGVQRWYGGGSIHGHKKQDQTLNPSLLPCGPEHISTILTFSPNPGNPETAFLRQVDFLLSGRKWNAGYGQDPY
jgi:hypothetical protein